MLKDLLSLIFILFSSITIIGQCEEDRYRNFIFPDHTLTNNIEYGNNIDYVGTETSLLMDVYEPLGDIADDRPLIIVVHGGSFVSGSRTGADVVPLCQDLARMGYVVASISYRLGIPLFGDINQNAKAAVIRGSHDSKAAVRFFRKDVVENSNSFRIDPDHIYMAGVSAGGFNALNVAYLNEDIEIPSDIDLSGEGLGGGAEGESGNADYSSEIAGVINVAGAIVDTNLIQAGDAPICSFHGTGDSVVPFGTDVLTFFGVIEVDTVYGSEPIHARADALGIENCFEIQWLQGHVPHVTNTLYYDTLLSVTSNFLSHLICPEIELDCEYRDVEVVSSVDDLNGLETISLWPNPVQDALHLEGLANHAIRYHISDLTGNKIKSGQILGSETLIDTGSLSTGIYLIQLESNDDIRTLRFVKRN